MHVYMYIWQETVQLWQNFGHVLLERVGWTVKGALFPHRFARSSRELIIRAHAGSDEEWSDEEWNTCRHVGSWLNVSNRASEPQ